MAEALVPSSPEDTQPAHKFFTRRCRKSGCSNIFTGLNLHQLHRLFRTAGDRDAEHRAKLVWRGMDAEGAGDEKEEEDEDDDDEEEVERGDEAMLAQALVGLRVRARNKTGFRAEGQKDHKWLRASGYLRIDEPLSGCTVEDEEADSAQSLGQFLLQTEDDVSEHQNPFKPSTWRLGVSRLESRDSERYLHRILH